VNKTFFFEKKNQKTFVNWAHRWFHNAVSELQSFFASFFQKKK